MTQSCKVAQNLTHLKYDQNKNMCNNIVILSRIGQAFFQFLAWDMDMSIAISTIMNDKELTFIWHILPWCDTSRVKLVCDNILGR